MFAWQWILLECLSLLEVILALYLLVTFCTVQIHSHRNSANGQTRLDKVMSLFMFLSLAFSAISCCFTQASMWLGFSKSKSVFCAVYAHTATWSHSASLCFCYISIWVKIKLFYKHPIMNAMLTPGYRRLSVIVLVLIISEFLFHGSSYTTPYYFVAGPTLGCTALLKSSTDRVNYDPLISLIVLTLFAIACAVVLPGMLIYPMFRSAQTASDGSLRRREQLNHRLLISTAVCVMSFLLASVVLCAVRSATLSVSNLIYELVLLINSVAFAFSFSNWKTRLFPFCAPLATDKNVPNQRKDAHNTHAVL